jgi:hypothetical protein
MSARYSFLTSNLHFGSGAWPKCLSEDEADQIVIASRNDKVFEKWNKDKIFGNAVVVDETLISILRGVEEQISAKRYSVVTGTKRSLRYAVGEFTDGLHSFKREYNRSGISDLSIGKANDLLLENIKPMMRTILEVDSELSVKLSFLTTVGSDGAMFQDPHTDFKAKLLANSPLEQRYIGFFALDASGMFLQVWDSTAVMGQSKVVFVPYGSIYIVPGETIHSGGFKTFGAANHRGHLYIWVKIPAENQAYNDYSDVQGDSLTLVYKTASVLQKMQSIWPNSNSSWKHDTSL